MLLKCHLVLDCAEVSIIDEEQASLAFAPLFYLGKMQQMWCSSFFLIVQTEQ